MAKKRKERSPARPSPAQKKPPAPRKPAKPADSIEPDEDDAPPHDHPPGAPIVGIGASAGGLDAFKRFFAAMPPKSGIAFVLIPHLDPKHESLMVELLSRHTKMEVVEAEEGMAVEPNRVYVIPPNKYMTIEGGVLRLTGNEELQSANEELETSKEELQSLNEELSTVNNQLQEKVEQLEQTNNDMTNLLNCTDVATVFLDADMRIRRFTPSASELLNAVETDVGRPITEVKLKFKDAELVPDAEAVLRELTPRQKDVLTDDGHWWIRRIIPYRTYDDHIEGVVITFNDVTALKLASLQANLLATVLRTTGDAVIVHDLHGQITHWNRGAEKLYGYTESEARTMNMREIIPKDQRGDYFEVVERVRSGERVDSWETQRVAKGEKIVDVWVTANAMTDESGTVTAIAKIDRDLTERKHAQESEVAHRTSDLKESEARLQAILNAPDDAIITVDKEGVIDSVNPAAQRMFRYTPKEMIGDNLIRLLPSLGDEAQLDLLQRFRETAGAHGVATSRELEARRKDGSVVWVELAVNAVENSNLFIGILRDVSRRKELEREVVEIAALEQQRIGQDLHDECGQRLTALAMMAGTLAETLKKDAPAQVERAKKLAADLSAVLRQVRGIAQGLATAEVAGPGLPAALADLTARLSENSGIQCTFEGQDDVKITDQVQATHLYHIAQEACTNALKHAEARQVAVRMYVKDNANNLEVRDDGVGIPDEVKNGLGLRIMKNRAAVIGATLRVERVKPKGTIVTCTLAKEKRHGRK